MGSWMLPMLSAAKNRATGATQTARYSDEHADHQAQVAVAAGDRGDEPVVDGGDLHGAGEPGEGAADEEGQQAVLPGGHAEQEGGPVVGARGLELEPEVRALQQDVDHDDGQDPQAQRPGAQAQPGDGGQGQLVGEGLGAAHGADARALPRPEDEPQGEGGGHEVEAEAAEDLVDAAEGLEHPGQRGPEGAADHAGEDGQDDDERGGEAGVLQQAQHPGGEDGAEDDLPLDADVPEAGGERHQDARRRRGAAAPRPRARWRSR